MMARIKRHIVAGNQEGPEAFGPAKVRVVMKNGKVLEASIDKAKGDPENPMSPEEIQEKYRTCCSGILTEPSIEKSISILQDLEDLTRLSELMACYRVTR